MKGLETQLSAEEHSLHKTEWAFRSQCPQGQPSMAMCTLVSPALSMVQKGRASGFASHPENKTFNSIKRPCLKDMRPRVMGHPVPSPASTQVHNPYLHVCTSTIYTHTLMKYIGLTCFYKLKNRFREGPLLPGLQGLLLSLHCSFGWVFRDRISIQWSL